MPCLLEKQLEKMHRAAKVKPALHSFPDRFDLRKLWYAAIKPFRMRYQYQDPLNDQLCSLHFKPSDFTTRYRHRILSATAVPSVFRRKQQKTSYASCCVPRCQTVARDRFDVRGRLFPFVPELTTQFSSEVGWNGPSLSRKRYRLWVRTLQVEPCRERPNVWVCQRHFVKGSPAPLNDCHNVDWVPSLHLESIPPNPCRECCVVLQKIPLDGSREDSPVPLPNLAEPFCRLCLEQNVPLLSIFSATTTSGNQLTPMIRKIAGIKIDLEQDSNGFICHDCRDKLEQMETITARWDANNELLGTLRNNNNQREQNPIGNEETEPPVVSIPMDHLVNSIMEPSASEDVKEEQPADISQDCVIVEQTIVDVIDLTEIDERDRLIRTAMRGIKKQLRTERKRTKSSRTSSDEPLPQKSTRNTRIG